MFVGVNDLREAVWIGPLCVSIPGTSLTADDRSMLSHPNVGVIVLFSENYTDKSQLQDLVEAIRQCNPAILISVDHEGVIWRFHEGFTRIESAISIGKFFSSDKKSGLEKAYEQGLLMATELRECGVDFSYAPVLDTHCEESTIIGKLGRSFSSSPDIIAILGEQFILGMNAAGMPAIGKHFPDHGQVQKDSHHALPIDNREESALQESLMPYKILIQKGLLQGIMMSHIIYPKVDSNNVASLSSAWSSLLRNQLGFKQGVIFTDCLTMGALSNFEPKEKLEKAVAADGDFVMYTHLFNFMNVTEILALLDSVPQNKDSEQRRILFYNYVSELQTAPPGCRDLFLRVRQEY